MRTHCVVSAYYQTLKVGPSSLSVKARKIGVVINSVKCIQMSFLCQANGNVRNVRKMFDVQNCRLKLRLEVGCTYRYKLRSCLRGERKILEGETAFRWVYMQKFCPCGYHVGTMAGDYDRRAICALLLSFRSLLVHFIPSSW